MPSPSVEARGPRSAAGQVPPAPRWLPGNCFCCVLVWRGRTGQGPLLRGHPPPDTTAFRRQRMNLGTRALTACRAPGDGHTQGHAQCPQLGVGPKAGGWEQVGEGSARGHLPAVRRPLAPGRSDNRLLVVTRPLPQGGEQPGCSQVGRGRLSSPLGCGTSLMCHVLQLAASAAVSPRC